jgi:hypothetical protein
MVATASVLIFIRLRGEAAALSLRACTIKQFTEVDEIKPGHLGQRLRVSSPPGHLISSSSYSLLKKKLVEVRQID